jgi:hypothetical protein
MKSLKSSILITSIGAVLTFLSVVYVSCQKAELNPEICQDLICQHGGYCFQDTFHHTHYCKCPFGYTGDSCTVLINAKFVGTWTVHETVAISNNPSYTNTTRNYIDTIVAGNVPNGFFINNFTGDKTFYEVPCVIDSSRVTNSLNNHFTFYPQFAPVQNPNFHITGGVGSTPDNSGENPHTITGTYYTDWLNYNFQNGIVHQKDTVNFTMTRP